MSNQPAPFNVIKFRANPTVFASESENMTTTRSATATAQGGQAAQRPPSGGRPSSADASRNTVEQSRPQSMSSQTSTVAQAQQFPVSYGQVTVPSRPQTAADYRATGTALEHPVLYDRKRVDGILSQLSEYENQASALRHRFGGLIRDVQDFNFENGENYASSVRVN